MPFISVIVPTMRVGGLDILFEGLSRQTFKNFELILVDGLYNSRRSLIQGHLKNYQINATIVEPKDNPFPVNSFSRFANTGLAHASGEVVLFLVDYTFVPPTLLETHAKFHQQNPDGMTGLMSPHRYLTPPALSPGFPKYDRENIDGYVNDLASGRLGALMWSVFEKHIGSDFKPESLAVDTAYGSDPKLIQPAGPLLYYFFHGKNESCRLKHVLDINGWDEDLDGTHGWQDSDLSDRLEKKVGLRWVCDPTNVAYILNPRHVFPFAKRLRPYETNKEVWQKKMAAGYPTPNKWNLRDLRENTRVLQQYSVDGIGGFLRFLVDDKILVGGKILNSIDAAHLQEKLGVEAVINTAEELSDQNKGIKNLLECGMDDFGGPREMEWFTKPLDFAWGYLKAGKRVYVHCAAGMSRSPAVAYVLLRGVLGLSPSEALRRLRMTRTWYGDFSSNQVYLNDAEKALAQWKPPSPSFDRLDTVIVEEYSNALYENHATRRWLMDDLVLIGGSILSSEDAKHLEKDLGVAAVINLETEHSDEGKGIAHLLEDRLPDDGTVKPADWFTKALDFAKPFIEAKQRVHVHCQQGGSRSPTVGYAILRGLLGLSPAEAVGRIRRNPHAAKFGEHPFHLNYLASAEQALSHWKK